MAFAQWYTTNIADRRGNEVAVLSMPAKTLKEPNLQGNPQRLIRLLGLRIVHPINSETDLQSTLSGLLADEATGPSPVVRDFVHTLATEHFIPIERSPLKSESLTAIAGLGGKTSVVAAGTYIDLAAFAGHPLLMIAAPVEIILIGASVPFGKAVGEGLANKVRKLMGVPKPTSRSRSKQAKE
jgi:hypothetical protein